MRRYSSAERRAVASVLAALPAAQVLRGLDKVRIVGGTAGRPHIVTRGPGRPRLTDSERRMRDLLRVREIHSDEPAINAESLRLLGALATKGYAVAARRCDVTTYTFADDQIELPNQDVPFWAGDLMTGVACTVMGGRVVRVTPGVGRRAA